MLIKFILKFNTYNTLINVNLLFLNNWITIFFIIFICSILSSATSIVKNIFRVFLNKFRFSKTCIIVFKLIIQIVSIMTAINKLIVVFLKTTTMFKIFIMFINNLKIYWFLLLSRLLLSLYILLFKFLLFFYDLRNFSQQRHLWFVLSQRLHLILI